MLIFSDKKTFIGSTIPKPLERKYRDLIYFKEVCEDEVNTITLTYKRWNSDETYEVPEITFKPGQTEFNFNDFLPYDGSEIINVYRIGVTDYTDPKINDYFGFEELDGTPYIRTWVEGLPAKLDKVTKESVKIWSVNNPYRFTEYKFARDEKTNELKLIS